MSNQANQSSAAGIVIVQPAEATLVRPAKGWERLVAVLCHLSTIFCTPVLVNLLVPVIVLAACGPSSEYVTKHAKEALNFQISALIWLVISAVACLVVVGYFMLIGLGVVLIILPIVAAIKVSVGKDVHYPWTFRLVK